MKIRTVTCHDVYNLGASLQAFALQTYMTIEGYDYKIIDYKPAYRSQYFNLWSVSARFNKPIVRYLYLAAKLPERLIALKTKRAFDEFTSNYLSLTKRYSSYEEILNDPPEADVYIVGSDMVWATFDPEDCGRDNGFFLRFGASNTKRISYAASFGSPVVHTDYIEKVKNNLKTFNAVSIRERTSLPLLSSLGRNDGVGVCDPVFLLSKQQWIEILDRDTIKRKAPIEVPYIFVYLTSKSESIKRIALDMKSATGWKVCAVGSIKATWADRQVSHVGPLDFIRFLYNAEFIISNSFHATSFSLILEKNFCVVKRQDNINERMKSVLCDYCLCERMVDKYSCELLKDIDYSVVRLKLSQIVTESKGWLQNNINK